jgi:serine/threonine protein kinase
MPLFIEAVRLFYIMRTISFSHPTLDRTIKLLGQGTFAKVVEAIDTDTNTKVAIKIIKAIPKYREASKNEVRVLQKLRERDPTNRRLGSFQELLGSRRN